MYIFQLMDYYAASGMSMLFLVFFQTISISWIFGGKRFCDCVQQMIGFRPSYFYYICWVYLAPVVMLVNKRSLIIHQVIGIIFLTLFSDANCLL